MIDMKKNLENSKTFSETYKTMAATFKVLKERDGKRVFPVLKYGNPFVKAAIKTIQQASRNNGFS